VNQPELYYSYFHQNCYQQTGKLADGRAKKILGRHFSNATTGNFTTKGEYLGSDRPRPLEQGGAIATAV